MDYFRFRISRGISTRAAVVTLTLVFAVLATAALAGPT